MERTHRPSSLTSWVTDYVTQMGLRAHVQVMRAEERVFILISVTQPNPPDLFGSVNGRPSVAESLLKALQPRLDPSVTLGGLHWNWTRGEIKAQSTELIEATRSRLQQKIQALRLRRTDIGLDAQVDGDASDKTSV